MPISRSSGAEGSQPCRAPSPGRPHDGIICFGGEDWWYHNRGHHDLQMMKQAARRMPVLYVNSIGMRLPRPGEGRMFLRRVGRKVASWRRGLVMVDDRLAVLSPPAVPGRRGRAINAWLLPRTVRAAMRRVGIHDPLVWVACPAAAEVVSRLNPGAIVYQRTDRYECFPGVNAAWIGACDARLKAQADLTLFCSSRLHRAEAGACRLAAYVDHGVEADRFILAGRDGAPEPDDVARLPRPRVGFVGGIDAHTFDPKLFNDVARRLPDLSFVLVGACSLPEGWCDQPNVASLGRRAYEDVASYMAACNVLIMPWRGGSWIDACNPVKLKEYLAVGRPVVSTPFAELRHYRGLVRVATDADTFALGIRAALTDGGDAAVRRQRVAAQTWAVKFDEVANHLHAAGVMLPAAPTTSRSRAGIAARVVEVPPTWTSGAGPRGRESIAHVVAAGGARACIVLAGGLAPSPLVRAAGRCVLDLSITPRQTVLERWVERVRALPGMEGGSAPIRIVHGAVGPVPWPRAQDASVRVELEPRRFRGPAGVLRDVCAAYGADDVVLVVEASRDPAVPVGPLLAAHRDRGAEVTVACLADDAPAGMYVVRCGALAEVADAGYVDLKEQWLRGLADRGRHVAVHRLPGPGAPPLRTAHQFLEAVRRASGFEATAGWRVVCDGAIIGTGAIVTESIVMPGARIGAGAIVARSIICPGSTVQAGTDIADAVVSTRRGLSDHSRDRARLTRGDHECATVSQAVRGTTGRE